MSVLPTRQQPQAWRLWQVCFRLLDRLSPNPPSDPLHFLTSALLRFAPALALVVGAQGDITIGPRGLGQILLRAADRCT